MKRALTVAASFTVIVALGCGVADADHLVSPGEAVFIRECAKCHQVGENARNRVGPVLNGIFGRQAGTVPGFRNYSDALRQSGIIWTAENFRSFVKNPKAMVVGTKQVYRGLKDDESVTLLIEFLKTK